MRILHSISELSEVPGPVCVAIGVFDGVHLGHQALIRRAMDEAGKCGGSAVVLTFHPHPARVLRPASAPHLLTSAPHKRRLIGELGCRYLLEVAFDEAFARQAPEIFIEMLVRSASFLRMICVGHNWAFGRNRSGNTALLGELGKRLNFETVEIEPVIVKNELVSSTRVRKAIQKGEFGEARILLGREYTILGAVQHGAGLGGRIGFPTANLAAHNEQFPPDGVYAVRMRLGEDWRDGVANIGVRPTVSQTNARLLEVHILDYSADCYGEEAEVRFEQFLRPEKKFESVEALKGQIACDVAEARRALAV